jgi:hypothetical protein
VYFFGLTHHTFEHFSQLPQAVIAFVLSDKSQVVLVPARWLWDVRHKLSSSPKQVKVVIDKLLHLKVQSGAGKPIAMTAFHERFDLLATPSNLPPPTPEPKQSVVQHSQLQGMLLEIGRLRGFETHCPNKSPRFKGSSLGELASLKSFPKFPGINGDIVSQIDVIWLEKSFPMHAFEIELTTGIWSGLVRLSELKRLNTVLHVVTDGDEKAYHRRIAGDIFAEIMQRCHHASADEIRQLYETETRLHGLRQKLTL